MRFEVHTDYMDPIEIDPYEHVTVALPNGRRVTVYSDAIWVTPPGHSERKIWEAMTAGSRRYPWGKVRQPAVKNDSDEEAARS